MQHPFAALAPEYTNLLQIMRVTRVNDVDHAARKLLANKQRYVPVSTETKVPIPVLATFHERESSSNFRTNLGQGDPLSAPSIHVPKGRPPLGAPPNDHFPVSWEYAAIDAIHQDHLDDNSAPWSLVYACWKGEAWNGFGPRNHGKHTGYLWSGTNIYTGGKYIADGVWSPDFQDTQLGIVPIMIRMIELDPSLAFGAALHPPEAELPIVPAPQPAPDGLANARFVQRSLNMLGQNPPLIEDGSYGRRTREAVRAFQESHNLQTDGLAGPKTITALHAALAAIS